MLAKSKQDLVPAILSLGEGMLELATNNGAPILNFGGDTLNTAIYLSRLGVRLSYLTAVGRDPFSDDMLALLGREAISTRYVVRENHKNIGIYLIKNDIHGEREFYYWRSDSAAKAFFSSKKFSECLYQATASVDGIYLTGITLSLLGEQQLKDICESALSFKKRGGEVFFDTNYRPRGWPSPDAARKAISRFAPCVTVALPTYGDEVELFDDSSQAASIIRWRQLGAREVVLKDGANGALVAHEGMEIRIPTKVATVAVDTTGAGDSFNAGYIASRLKGEDPASAVNYAHRLACAVIGHKGAVIPKACMLDVI